jgi:hypothetical protein
MALSKIQFAPGVDKEGTQYTADAGWFDSDKIRFRKGRVEKIGGWTKYSLIAISGVIRSIKDWGATTGERFLGIGTNLKMYLESGSIFYDITPVRATTTGEATFSASTGSSSVTVFDVAHGAELNDYVTFSSAISLGGNITADVLNKEYRILEILDPDSYVIHARDSVGDPVLATALDAGNGGTGVVSEYQVNTGLNNYLSSTGWSVNGWGNGGWSSSSALSAVNQLRVVSQDAFGDNLIFNFRAGGVYIWQLTSGVGARAVSLTSLGDGSAPQNALSVMVSDVDRHVVCFGATPIGASGPDFAVDPLLIRWSDQENATEWFPSATNSAGGQVLSVGTEIVGAIKTRQEILVSTDGGLVSMRFVGAPFIYSFQPVAENASFIGPNAAVAVGDAVYFMDRGGFYVYSGSVQRIPCSVHRHVYENINKGQGFKVVAGSNPDFSEVIWFYQVGNNDITNYVSFNYLENVWAVGTLERGAFIQTEARQYPIAGSNNIVDLEDNYLYNHEFGYDADGDPLSAYVESGDMGIGDGDSFMYINRIVSDFDFSGATTDVEVDVKIKGRNFPLDDLKLLSSSRITANTRQSHVRTRARESVIRIESAGAGYGWSVGDMRFGIRTDGRR